MTATSRKGPSDNGTNGEAAEHLMNGFRERLMWVARRNSRSEEDAEDAFGRTVELTLRSCPIRGEMAEVEAWATVVCRREAWKIARRYRRKPAGSLDALLDGRHGSERRPRELGLTDRTQASPEDRACDAETRREVYAAIARLPQGQRAVIEPYAHGWSSREIAASLGRSHRSVRKGLWRGKRTLRAVLRP
ncbi:MAG: RNA polymerase sigma factor [Candidatus Limnocylindria bacterium]